LVSSLAQNSLIGSPVAGQAAQGLIQSAQSNPLTSGPLADNYNTAVQNLQKLKSDIAAHTAGIQSEPITLEFQQGRLQALNNMYATQIDAAQQAVQQAQTAMQQGISEQGQQQSGYNQAGNLGVSAQGQLQSGLTSAAGAAAPQLGQYGQTYYNPLGNGTSGGGSGGTGTQISPNDPFYQTLQQYAQLAAQGNTGSIPSSITSNPVLNAQMLQMAKQINPNFNPTLAQASAQTQATGQQASAAAPAAFQALDALQTAYNGLGAMTGGTNIPILNQAEQGIAQATGLGRQQVSNYQSSLSEARAQIDAVLSSIIGVQAAGQVAQNLLPDSMVPSEVPQRISAAKQYITQRIQSYTSSGQQAGQVPSNTSNVAGGMTPGSIYNF
jgi:hypothetical protein